MNVAQSQNLNSQAREARRLGEPSATMLLDMRQHEGLVRCTIVIARGVGVCFGVCQDGARTPHTITPKDGKAAFRGGFSVSIGGRTMQLKAPIHIDTERSRMWAVWLHH